MTIKINKRTGIVSAIAFAVMMALCAASKVSVVPALVGGVLYFFIKIIQPKPSEESERAAEQGKWSTVICWLKRLMPVWIAIELYATAWLSERMVQYLLLDAENRARISDNHQALNVWCALVWILVWLVITARPKFACIIGHISLLVLAGINYFVYQFRGNEFSFGDLKAASTGLSVAAQYDFTLEIRGVCIIIAAIVYVALLRKFDFRLKQKWVMRIAALAVLLVLAVKLSDKTDNIVVESWEQKGTYRNGYILNFVLSIRDSFVSAPDGYTSEEIAELESQFEETQNVGSQDDPTIIVIMNESFANLGVLGDLQTSEPVTPFLDSMSENTVKGYTLSSVFGAKTPDSEWEFLTGNSMAFLPSGSVPYQQYLSDGTYSLVSTLKERGYTCLAMHPYYETGWSRNKVYPMLGFEESYFIDDFDQTKLMREYITDEEMYNKIINQFEAKDEGEKMFVMSVSMQNHGGYTDYYPNFSDTVTMTNGYYSDVNQYLSLINESDKALEQLITYFESVDEKVEIVFFGDHQPSLNSYFYQQMNGRGLSGLTLSELEDLFKVPFFIWTNYDSEEKEVELTSLNYLSTMALEQAEIELPPYNQFLRSLMETIPAMNARAYYSSQNSGYLHYEDSVGVEEQLLREYEMLQYNNMFDNDEKSEIFFPFYSGEE